MQIEVIEKRDEPLFERQRLRLKVGGISATPKRADLIPQIAAQLGVEPQMVEVVSIRQSFGQREAQVEANIYANEGALRRFGRRILKEEKAEKAEGEQKVEAEKVEEKAEEKKEGSE